MLQVDISNQDMFLYEMIVHLDVLSLSVETWVASEMDVAHVVAI